MRKHAAVVFWWAVALILVLWPIGLALAGEAKAAATAADWAADPENAFRAVMAQASSLAQLKVTTGALGMVLAGVGAAVAVLRLTPAWGPLIGFAWDVLAPKSIKLSEQQQATQAQGFQVLVKTIEQLPADGTLGELRDKLARKMPDPIKQAVDSYLDQHGRTLHVVSEAPKA